MATNSNENKDQSVEEDFRINCTTTRGLQNIMNIVGKYVSELSESVELPEEREAFTKRFLGIFKSSLQENVTVNGLRWIPDKHTLTKSEKDEEVQNQKEVLASRLCKSVADVALKRKTYPPQCRKVMAMTYQHDLENLEKTRVKVPKIVPTLPDEDCSHLTSKNIKTVLETLKTVNEVAPKSMAETDKTIETFTIASKSMKRKAR